MTAWGTRRPISPLMLLLSVPTLSRQCFLSFFTVVISYPRNLAASLLAWVMSVFSSERLSLSSSLKNLLSCRLISSASDFGPINARSGKGTPAMAFPPLRTGLVPLKTSGSSTSRTTRLLVFVTLYPFKRTFFFCQQILVVVLLTVTYGSFSFHVNLLVTEQVNQCQIIVAIFAPKRSGQEVMNLYLFIIEERFPTFWASTFLSLGKFLF